MRPNEPAATLRRARSSQQHTIWYVLFLNEGKADMEQQILEARGRVAPEPRVHYVQHEFDVPEGATGVSVTLRYHKQNMCQLFLSIFDPAGFRGCHMQPGARRRSPRRQASCRRFPNCARGARPDTSPALTC